MARPQRPPRIQACNLLRNDAVTSELLQFSISGGRERLQQARELPLDGAVPPAAVRKGWRDLLQGRLNLAWLPLEHIYLRLVSVPTNDPAELPAMLELQLEKLSPLPVGQIVWSYEPLPGRRENATDVALLIVETGAVEAFLGQIEARGLVADRLDFPLLHQLVATPFTDDGAYLYPLTLGARSACLVAWWAGGAMRALNLVNLPADDQWASALEAELNRIAWAGEVEGWLAGPQTITVVADEAASSPWRTALEGRYSGRVKALPALSSRDLAALNARRAATHESRANLLPPAFAARYRQQFLDRLWMGGLGAAVAVYLVGVLLYLGAVEVLKWKQAGLNAELAQVSQVYTNALRVKAHATVLQEQINLRYAALDCWKAGVETLPAELTLQGLTFSKGRTLQLSGYGPGDQVDKITEFSKALGRKVVGDTNLFSRVDVQSSTIRPGPLGPQTVFWSLVCEVKRPEI